MVEVQETSHQRNWCSFLLGRLTGSSKRNRCSKLCGVPEASWQGVLVFVRLHRRGAQSTCTQSQGISSLKMLHPLEQRSRHASKWEVLNGGLGSKKDASPMIF